MKIEQLQTVGYTLKSKKKDGDTMAYWTSPKDTKVFAEPITLGDGVNTYTNIYQIKKSEAFDSRNTSSREYPALSVRQGCSLSFDTNNNAITTPNGAGVRNSDTFHIVDGTTWKYWNGSAWVNVATGLTNSTAKIVELNRTTDKLTIMFNGTEKKAYDGSTVIDLTEADATKFITIDDERLYTLSGNLLKCSAFLVPTDFSTFEDYVPITIAGMQGVGTGIVAYQDIIIAFSDKTMHLLYGDDFRNFQLMDPIQAGCVSDRSIIEHDGKLYFLDYGQYKVFTGGFPVEMSQKVSKYLDDINYTYKDKIVAGKQGKYIYLSIPYGSDATTNNITLEYDTEYQTWYVISKGYLNFVSIGNDLYGVRTTGIIDKMNTGTADGSTAISWYHSTGILDILPVKGNETLSDIYIECLLPSGSTMEVGYSTNTSDTFTTISNISASAVEQKSRIQVPTTILQNVERYRLKFSGNGPATIHFVEFHKQTQR